MWHIEGLLALQEQRIKGIVILCSWSFPQYGVGALVQSPCLSLAITWLGRIHTFFTFFICCSVTQLYPTIWDCTDCSMPSSLSFTISRNLLKLMSIESMISSDHLILCHPLLPLPLTFAASGSFLVSWLFATGGQSIGTSALASFLLMNFQDWFPLGLTGWSCSPRDSQESSPTPQFKTISSLVFMCSVVILFPKHKAFPLQGEVSLVNRLTTI